MICFQRRKIIYSVRSRNATPDLQFMSTSVWTSLALVSPGILYGIMPAKVMMDLAISRYSPCRRSCAPDADVAPVEALPTWKLDSVNQRLRNLHYPRMLETKM